MLYKAEAIITHYTKSYWLWKRKRMDKKSKKDLILLLVSLIIGFVIGALIVDLLI